MESLATSSSRDRRFVQRHNIKTALRVRVWKSGLPEERAESLNLSQRGIFFLTDTRLAEGEIVEILVKMPEEISGEPTAEWRCTGHVVRVERSGLPGDKFGIGVHFYCYEASRVDQSPLSEVPRSLRHMPVPSARVHHER